MKARKPRAAKSVEDVTSVSNPEPSFDFDGYLDAYAKNKRCGISTADFLAEVRRLCPHGVREVKTNKDGNEFSIVRIPPFSVIIK